MKEVVRNLSVSWYADGSAFAGSPDAGRGTALALCTKTAGAFLARSPSQTVQVLGGGAHWLGRPEKANSV